MRIAYTQGLQQVQLTNTRMKETALMPLSILTEAMCMACALNGQTKGLQQDTTNKH